MTSRNLVLVSLMSCTVLACKGDTGPAGPAGSQGDPGSQGNPGATTGTLGGVVTDGIVHDPLSGVTVTAADPGGGTLATATTGADGKFSFTLDAGPIDLTFVKTDYTPPGLLHSGVGINGNVQVAVTMNESASGKPSVSIAAPSDDIGYGAQVTLAATASDPNGDTLAYKWANTTDPALDSDVSPSGVVTMPSMDAAFSTRADSTGMSISGYKLQDRFGVVPIMTDTRGQISAQLTVSDGRGQSASASVTINAASVVGSIRDVSVGQRVYVNSGHDGTNSWTLTAPAGSKATLDDAAARTPSFITDIAGPYTLCEGACGLSVAISSNVMTIFADTFYGMAIPQAGDTTAYDTQCTTCHGGLGLPQIPNMFDQYSDPVLGVTTTGWVATKHATTFARGIDGTLSAHFNGSCAGCHATAFDSGVANGGFDDVAIANGWTFPATLSATNWQNMMPEVARLANVQCEACHGPQGVAAPAAAHPAHDQTLVGAGDLGNKVRQPFQSPRISYGAEACGTCHAAGGDHIYTEWATPSAKFSPDVNDYYAHSSRGGASHAWSTDSKTGITALSTSCGRCHSSQGYTLYANLLKQKDANGNATPVVTLTMTCTAGAGAQCDPRLPAPITDPTSTLRYVTGANVEPVTCVACHDPHDATNPYQLRFTGDLAMTPAGFAVQGAGKGALCISCHNSRNGTTSASDTATFLHEDVASTLPSFPSSGYSYSAPHLADQGDVFEGHNAWFMGANMPMTSKHAAVTDTCVGCHMTLQPASFTRFGAATPESHLFRITDDNQQQLCSNCHGSAVNGAGIQGGVTAQLDMVAAMPGALLKAKIAANAIATTNPRFGITLTAYNGTEGDASFGLYSAPVIICTATPCPSKSVSLTPNLVTAASFTDEDVHGQIALDITLRDPVAINWVDSANNVKGSATVTEFKVQLGSVQDETATALFGKSGDLTKAGWNYFLVIGDQSKGLHNPSFVTAVLNNTYAKLTQDVTAGTPN